MNTRNNHSICIAVFSAILLLAGALVLFYIFGNKNTDTLQTESSEPETASMESASSEPETEPVTEKETESPTEAKLASMTLDEKIAQLFFVTPEMLTEVDGFATIAGDGTRESFRQYPVGGIIYFPENIESEEQLKKMLADMQTISTERIGLPVFLATDEEGGRVARLANSDFLSIENVGAMADIGSTGDSSLAYDAGQKLGTYLTEYGFNVDFAPVADIATPDGTSAIGDRSFGSDAARVSEMVTEAVAGFQSTGIHATVKHFPGHGATLEDSHDGLATLPKSQEELEACEYLPFRAGIEAGVDFVMVGHIVVPSITGEGTPSTLSREMIQEQLRGNLGFDGIVITDAMNMGAIANLYSAEDAAVQALEAGIDIILMPADFKGAFEAVKEAVADGRLTEERINESVRRILELKMH